MRNQYVPRNTVKPFPALIRAGLLSFCFCFVAVAGQCQRLNFNHGWRFYKFKSGDVVPHQAGLYDTSKKGFNSQFTNENINVVAGSPEEIEKRERLDAERQFASEYTSILQNSWEAIDLPHSANIEPLVPGPDIWQ